MKKKDKTNIYIYIYKGKIDKTDEQTTQEEGKLRNMKTKLPIGRGLTWCSNVDYDANTLKLLRLPTWLSLVSSSYQLLYRPKI